MTTNEPEGSRKRDRTDGIRPSRAHPGSLISVGAAGGAAVIGVAAVLGGCGGGTTDGARDDAAVALDEAVARVHQTALDVRAEDPAAVGAAAADNLGQSLTDGNRAILVSTATTAHGVEALTTAGVRVEEGGGLFYEQVTLGACLLTSAAAGSPTGDAGERGIVTTMAVACPDGVTPVVDTAPVEATTLDIDRHRSPVPLSRPTPCFSGSGDCETGG